MTEIGLTYKKLHYDQLSHKLGIPSTYGIFCRLVGNFKGAPKSAMIILLVILGFDTLRDTIQVIPNRKILPLKKSSYQETLIHLNLCYAMLCYAMLFHFAGQSILPLKYTSSIKKAPLLGGVTQ